MTSMQTLKSEKLVLNFLALGADLETANRLAANQMERENYVRPMTNNSDVFLTKFDGSSLK